LAVFDLSRPWTDEDEQVFDASKGIPTLVILNKSDLPQRLSMKKIESFSHLKSIKLSCLNGEGLEALRQWLKSYTEQQTPSSEMVITNERQYHALLEALDHLYHAKNEGYLLGPEFMAEDLRAARNSLASITGQVSSEEVLDALFSCFCIGK